MSTTKRLIAIAGGTSPTLGTSIVNALAGSKSCTPVIISRVKHGDSQAQTTTSSSGTTVEIRYVNYDDERSLLNALESVHTVISVILIPSPSWGPTQIALLNAAKKAGVRRFAPSEFELGPLAAGRIDITAGVKPAVWEACRASGLEVARFQCGGFYQALLQHGTENPRFSQHVKERMTESMHGLVDYDHMWSLRHEKVHELTTDKGTSPRITFTEIGDVGRFVAAACELPDGEWKQDMSMVGQTMPMAEATRLLEEISGVKLEREQIGRKVLDNKIAAVQDMGETEEEMMTKMWNQIELIMIDDVEGAGRLKPVLNEMCPHVKPHSVQEYLEKVFS